jgi:hypothetical protein
MLAEAREDRLHSNQSSTVWQEEIDGRFPPRVRSVLDKNFIRRWTYFKKNFTTPSVNALPVINT